MVLHADELDALALERVGGREVVGVQVVRDDLGRDVEEPLEVRDALAEGAQRLGVAQVADVVPDPGARALGQAERALELGAAGEHAARGGDRERERAGHEPARAAQQRPARRARRARRESSVRVWIGRSCSRNASAIAGQALERVVVVVGDRLVADVAAGHHQRRAGVGEQQVVQRGVGEHHAELARARARRRPRRGRRRAAAPARSAAPATGSSAASSSPSVDERPRRRQVARPSARTACPRGACARAAARPRRSSSARQARW